MGIILFLLLATGFVLLVGEKPEGKEKKPRKGTYAFKAAKDKAVKAARDKARCVKSKISQKVKPHKSATQKQKTSNEKENRTLSQDKNRGKLAEVKEKKPQKEKSKN